MKATATLEGCKTIEELSTALEVLAHNIRTLKIDKDISETLIVETHHRKLKIIITQS